MSPLLASQPAAATSSAEAGGTMIELAGLSKAFPVQRGWRQLARRPFSGEKRPALVDVSLRVAAGEFFGLLGPNGAGKTTLFKMLATLVLPDSGRALVGGLDVAAQPAAVRRLLAPVIADERSLHWRISARENLRLFAVLHGVPAAAADARIDELLGVVGLEDVGAKQVGRFSSGMRQRLLIARSLIARPRVLLLDEPTRSLDPISAREFRRFLRDEIVGAQGCTVMLATHSSDEAMELCDRVGILDQGRLLDVGAPRELAARYQRDRYRLWTTEPDHPGLASMVAHGTVRLVDAGEPAADGWTAVGLEFNGGPARAADVLAFLVENGVPVAGLERSRMSLADLISSVVERGSRQVPDA